MDTQLDYEKAERACYREGVIDRDEFTIMLDSAFETDQDLQPVILKYKPFIVKYK